MALSEPSAASTNGEATGTIGSLASIRNVAALIAAVSICQLATGLLGVHIPLAVRAHEISRAGLGLISALYATGFMLGAAAGPTLLARVGHIRVFAAAGATAAVFTLWLYWAQGLAAWVMLRFFAGFFIACLFGSAESWMNGALGRAERGGVLGFYHVCTKVALASGPFMIAGAGALAPEPLMTAAACFALALLPICLTSQAQPQAPKAQPLAIRALFHTAPAAVIACFGAGLINGAVLSFAPLYADQTFGMGSAAGFQAAAWGGALLLQWPAGRVSDHVDRRVVIAALVLSAGLAAMGLAMFGPGLPFWGAALVFAVWGSGGLSYYGLAAAHMADRAEPGQIPRATAGLLFIWASGSIVGPALVGALTQVFGLGAIFWFAAGASALVGGAMFWRRAQRDTPTQKAPFANKTETSISAAELTYGERTPRT